MSSSSATAAPIVDNVETSVTANATATPSKRTLTQILADLKTFLDVGRALYNELKPFEKEYSKIQKKMDQEAAKKEKQNKMKKEKVPAPDRMYHISPLFAEFMGVPADATMSRKQVMRAVYDYLKTNNLQNPAKKIQYFLDDKLSKLFEGTTDEESGKTFILSKDIMVQYHKHILAPVAESAPVPAEPAPASAPAPAPTPVPAPSNNEESEAASDADAEPEVKPTPPPKATKSAPASKPAAAASAAATKPPADAPPKAPVVVKKVVAGGKK